MIANVDVRTNGDRKSRSTSSTGSRAHSESNRFLVYVQSWSMRLARTNLPWTMQLRDSLMEQLLQLGIVEALLK